jgi:hypothetical protein
MEKVFQKLLMAFGNQLSAKWDGLPMQDVYQDWAEAMQQLTLGSINYGIEESKKNVHPPSQGEFIAHCKRFNSQSNLLKIESKLSPEKMEDNRKRIAEIARRMARSKAA